MLKAKFVDCSVLELDFVDTIADTGDISVVTVTVGLVLTASVILVVTDPLGVGAVLLAVTLATDAC